MTARALYPSKLDFGPDMARGPLAWRALIMLGVRDDESVEEGALVPCGLMVEVGIKIRGRWPILFVYWRRTSRAEE